MSKIVLHFSAVLFPVLPGQFAIEVTCPLVLPALKEGSRNFPAQAACVGLQKHGGIDNAEEQSHNQQHGGVGRYWGADPAAGRAEGQGVVVAPINILHGK